MNAKFEILKDNVASAAVMAATLLAFAGAAFGPEQNAAASNDVVQLEPVVITAQRMETVALDKIVVTASRVN